MATIVGIDTTAGVVLAGEGRATEGDVVRSDASERVFSYDGIGAAVSGDPGPVAEFDRQFDATLREHRLDGEVGLERAARLAAEVAADTGTDALVAARDDDGVARLREVDADGGVLETDRSAKGSGARLALGRLEGAGDVDLDGGESLAREALDAAADRDAGTGPNVTVWRLPDE